jgi:signal transduction histidine kinase
MTAMNESHKRRWRWLMAALVLGIWTLLGFFTFCQSYLVFYLARMAKPDLPAEVPKASWAELLQLNLAEWYIWGVLALFVFWLGRRFPLEKGRWPIGLLVHLGASVYLAFLESTISVLVSELLRRDIPKPTLSWWVLFLFFSAKFPSNVMIYWVVLGVSQFLAYYRKFKDRELRASQLEARLAEARLQVLKMQLHPHFLFNTLHAISALIHQDVEVADRMIARLGDLLRSTLDNADRQEVPLKRELDFIQPYLEIEQARLGSRLTVRMEIDPETMDASVPNLILQPLVENAIRHGIAPRAEPGRIEIHARREQEWLKVQVRDDGPGLAGDRMLFKEGVGLANTRARLQQLYGPAHRFELSNGSDRGLTVLVLIPFREADGAALAEREEKE